MKILFCNYEYPPLGGGGGVVMAALARELGRRHEVTVLTSRALDLPAESIDRGVRVVRVPVLFRRELAVANFPSMFAYLPAALLRGLGLRRAGAFDVINTHFVVPTGPVGHMLARLYGIPNVLSVHGGDLYDPSKASSPHRQAWLRRPIRYLLERADRLVGQSRNTLEHVETFYGVKRAADLISLGIERPPQAAPARASFGLPEDAFVMVTVGRLVARKATLKLLEALRRADRPKAHLLVVGDGPDAEPLRRAAAAAGLSERVHVVGQVSEARKLEALASADVFVSASQHEGFGLVFLEAMAFGLPVVCFDHGGQTDFLESRETGFVVRLNDMESFVGGIVELCDDRAMRERMGVLNRARVERHFIDECARRYEIVFEEVLRGRGAAASAAARP
jgi:glycosyltransferase involved in cell wall biosynthesis